MKTTIEISDNLMLRAKQLARQEASTLRGLVEEGLRLVLARREGAQRRAVEPVTFRGEGLVEELRGKGWEDIRDASYQGRGS